MEKKLYRDTQHKTLGGVCAGLADYFDVDVTWVKLAFVLGFFAGFGFLAYIVMWVVIPEKPYNPFTYMGQQTASNPSAQPSSASGPEWTAPNPPVSTPYSSNEFFKERAKKENNGKFVAGLILVSIGTIFLFNQLDILPGWFSLWKLWPLAILIPGIVMLSNAGRSNTTNTADHKPVVEPEEKDN